MIDRTVFVLAVVAASGLEADSVRWADEEQGFAPQMLRVRLELASIDPVGEPELRRKMESDGLHERAYQLTDYVLSIDVLTPEHEHESDAKQMADRLARRMLWPAARGILGASGVSALDSVANLPGSETVDDDRVMSVYGVTLSGQWTEIVDINDGPVTTGSATSAEITGPEGENEPAIIVDSEGTFSSAFDDGFRPTS